MTETSFRDFLTLPEPGPKKSEHVPIRRYDHTDLRYSETAQPADPFRPEQAIAFICPAVIPAKIKEQFINEQDKVNRFQIPGV